jgi:leader peptidase (prepilin peptidase) / N-methyltransferase
MGYLSPQELTGCAFAAVVAGIISVAYFPVPVVISTGLLTFLVAAITISDLRHFIIPDVLSLPAIPLGFAASWFACGNDVGGHILAMSAMGAVLGGASLYVIKIAYARLRGLEGLGMGDVKLMAVGGAWLGPENLALTLLLASLAALASLLVSMVILGRHEFTRHTPLPFGAFIAPAIWLVWIYQLTFIGQPMALFGS